MVLRTRMGMGRRLPFETGLPTHFMSVFSCGLRHVPSRARRRHFCAQYTTGPSEWASMMTGFPLRRVTVSATATFYETMVGGKADAGLPKDQAAEAKG